MKTPQRGGLMRATPPAIFPPLLGLFGVGLAWRQATLVFGVSPAISDALLGALSLLYVFACFAYLAKFLRRPAVAIEDLHILPGRLGLSAASAAGMLFAAALLAYAPGLARAVLWLAVGLHGVIALTIIYLLVTGPSEQRQVTPVWQLSFVGFIIAPLAAVPLGYPGFSQFVLFATMPLAVVVWLVHFVTIARRGVPAPLRPPLAIHLAPVCLFGIVAALLGFSQMAVVFGWLAILGMAILLLRLRYLVEAGFSPMWGAFTFPLAAFANLMLILAIQGAPFRQLGGVALVVATLVDGYIAFRIYRMWLDGSLAAKVNAARA